MKKKISIIIPVYNASKFIDKCLNSIIHQRYSNIEVILVNDGSIDNSLEILRKYEKKYDYIHVYSWENHGAAASRNYGIEKSTGDYILFVDSDDWVERDYVLKLVNNIGSNDFIVSGYQRFNDNELICKKIPSLYIWSAYKYNSSCGKLYRRDFLEKNNLKFSSKYKIGEDMFFTLSAISCTDKIKILNYAGYDNYANMESVTNSVNKNKETRNTMMLFLMKDILSRVQDSKYIDYNMLLFFFLKTSVLHLMTQRYILSQSEFYNEEKDYFDWVDDVSLKLRGKKFRFYWQKGEEMPINVICNLFVILRKIKLDKFLLWMLRVSKVGRFK